MAEAESLPTGAPRTSPSFCSQCGIFGSRTSSKWWFAITASRIGFGMPFLFVLPAAASEYIVAISRSNWSAGVTVQTKRTSSSPAFQNLCAVPGSTVDGLAGAELDRLLAAPHAERPREHLEALGLERVHVRRGDEAAGLHDRLEDDALAVRLGRGLVEDEPLAGDGILDLISCVEHLVPPRG